MTSASVVIPTRDRPASLGRCLRALAGGEMAGLEVIVVDDGSTDPDAVAAAARAVGARLVRLPGRGPAAARNAGAREAAGEVVLFTDDDCEPDPAWAAALAARAVEAGVAAGSTVSPPGATAAVVASQAITNHLQLSGLDRSMRLGFAPTSNLGCSRDALAALPFNESYPSAAGEDREWCSRAVAAGLAPRFEPGALVVHRQELTAPGFLGQQLRYGRGAARFRGEPSAARPAPSFYAGLVKQGLSNGPVVGGLVLASQAAVAAGFALERAALARNHPV